MATGEVILTGTASASSEGFGTLAANVFDDDLTNFWDASGPAGAWVALDLGAGKTAQISFVRIAPRPSSDVMNDPRYEIGVWGGNAATSLLSGSNTSAIAGLTTLKTLSPGDRWFRRYHLTEVAITNGTQWRFLRFSNDVYGDIGGLQWICNYANTTGSPGCRPLEPVITPGGKRAGDATPVSVAMTCRTTSATILYTTDGTTPAHVAGTPSGTTQVYSAAISITPTAGGVTLKAMAYDATCSTTDSMVAVSAPFKIQGFPQNDRLYQVGDLTGFSPQIETVEMHAAAIVRADGYYHGFGHIADCVNAGFNPGFIGFGHYRSTDALNWTLVDIAIGMESLSVRGDQGDLGVRGTPIYSATTGKWNLWIKALDAATTGTNSTAYIYISDSLDGPWGDGVTAGTPLFRDVVPVDSPRAYTSFSDFTFFEWGTRAIVLASCYDGATPYFVMQELDDDRTGCIGTGVEFAAGALGREGCVMFIRNGVYFIIASCLNYYDPAATFDVRYIVGTGGTSPLDATWTALDGTALFGVDPATLVGGDFNAQPSCVVQTENNGLLLYMDYWHQTNNFTSNHVVVELTFPTDTTVLASQAEILLEESSQHRHRTAPGRRALIAANNQRLARRR